MDIKLDVYNANCVKLAKSMELKCDLHALSVERWYTGIKEITTDRTEWLHYKNLAGEYHDYNEPMTITSLDTLETIEFSKDVLINHPTTLSLYQEFGKYYDVLIAKYPDNAVLIKGILYNNDIEDIIALDDFYIVGWNTNLVEVQEHDLISTLNKYLTISGSSAGSPDFIESENLWPSMIIAYLAANMPVLIKRVRDSNSLSYNAHSFHIWSHINAYIPLEQYKALLTYDDIMYLFKNIARLKNGACSTAIFNEVLETIVYPKSIQGYRLESKTEMSSINNDNQTASAIWNHSNLVDGEDSKLTTLADVISTQLDRSNYQVATIESDISSRLFEEYNTNGYPELTLYDTNESDGGLRELLVDVDYAYVFGGEELHTNYTEITMPHSGEGISLQYNQWMTIYKRIQQIRTKSKTDTIPYHDTTVIYSMDTVSRSTLQDCGLSDEFIAKIITIMGSFPLIKNDTSESRAYVENYSNTRRTIESLIETSRNKTNNLYIDQAYNYIFKHYRVQLEGFGENFNTWIAATGVELDDMSEDEISQLEYYILSDIVGIDGDSAAMLVTYMGGILSNFVSYRTNISKEVNDNIVLELDSRRTFSQRAVDRLGLTETFPTPLSLTGSVDGAGARTLELRGSELTTELQPVVNTTVLNLRGSNLSGTINSFSTSLTLRPSTLTASIRE